MKDELGYGHCLPWLEAEFGWSEPTAQRFMHVNEMVKSKSVKLTDLPSFDVSALYTLAAPSTAEPVRQITAGIADAGHRVTNAVAPHRSGTSSRRTCAAGI